MVRRVKGRSVKAGCGSRGTVVEVRPVEASHGRVRRSWQSRHVQVGFVRFRLGGAWQSWPVGVRRGLVRHVGVGMARKGEAVGVGHGSSRCGVVCCGLSR